MIKLIVVFLLIRSIFGVEIDENIQLSHGYNNQFLKTTSSTCTYSIGLSDMTGNGWDGNYVTVRINAIELTDQYTRVSSDSDPVWFSFQIQESDTLSVTFTQAGGADVALLYYSVTDGSSGGGNVIYTYMPLVATIPNTCIDECDYSIELYDGSGMFWSVVTTATVYLNGIPILSDIYITNSQSSEVFNFGTRVKSTDVITVRRPDMFVNGLKYAVFPLPDGQGDPLYQLTNDDSGPPPFRPIINYCGQNSSLGISTPISYAPQGATIPVTVSKYVRSGRFNVKVFLVCGEKTQTMMQEIRGDYMIVNYYIPLDFTGDCYFYASTVDFQRNPITNSISLPFIAGKNYSPFGGLLTFVHDSQLASLTQSLIPYSNYTL